MDVDEAAAPLVRLMREFRPQVVTTYDEDGGYPHPDHVMCHKISVAAFDAAGDPDRYPELGEPWQPSKLYYHVFSKGSLVAIHEAMLAAGLESPYGEWLEQWGDEHDKTSRVTTRVDCAEFFPVRDEALRAHATQVDPDGSWFRAPVALRQRVWPTEDYELARTFVDSKTPEDDLFIGVSATVCA
jgi:mycothiol S-conjugate amidase